MENNTFDRSEQINDLSAALSKAQGAMSHAAKDSNNPFFSSKYADLASVWEACRKALADNGLAVLQLPEPAEEKHLYLRTVLTHSSGQYISSVLKMPLVKVDPQGYGSAMTYARRYALAAIVGVYQDDDDANVATGRNSDAKNASSEKNTDDRKQGYGLKWDTFWANAKTFGLTEDHVIAIVSEATGKPVTKITDVIKTQSDLNKLTSLCAKHKKPA